MDESWAKGWHVPKQTGAQITTIFTLEKIKIKLPLFLSQKKKKKTHLLTSPLTKTLLSIF